MTTVAIATCVEVPDLDEDGPQLLQCLRDRNIVGRPLAWDDPTADWGAYDLVVLRSTWDYPGRWTAFLDWIDVVSSVTTLVNPAPVVRWNVDKRYQRSLSNAGIEIVPTWWIENTTESSVPEAVWSQGDEIVIKPVISAGSKDTARFHRSQGNAIDQLIAHILASGRGVMVQPYMHSVDTFGETALMFMGGAYSHAIRKGPLLELGGELEPGLFRKETIHPRVASDLERKLAERVLDAIPFDRSSLAYARIDLVRDPSGAPRVIELELIEPSLFLRHDDAAAVRLSEVLARMGARSVTRMNT